MSRSLVKGVVVFILVFIGFACAPEPAVGTSAEQLIQTPTSVLYADCWIDIGDNAMVNGGDVAVRQVQATGMREPNSPGAQIQIGANSFVGSSPASGPVHTLAGANITVGSGSWAGYVDTTTLTNNGAASIGPQSSFPTNLSPLPLSGQAGAVAIGSPLNINTPTTLSPGAYGPLMVMSTTVQLSAGTYYFTSVNLQNALLTTTSATTTVAIVTNAFMNDPASMVQPFSGGSAQRITIFTAGPSQFDGTTQALVLSHDDLEISHTFIGAAAASTIVIANGAQVTFQDGLNLTAPAGTQQLSGYYANQDTFCVQGEPNPGAELTLSLALALPDATALASFINDRSDPTSPYYRQWLTSVAAFKAQFGPTDADYTALQTWATTHGLTIVETFPTNLLLTVSGTVAQFEEALYTRFQYRDNGTAVGFLAPDRDPSIDLGPTVAWIAGLDDWTPAVAQNCGRTELGPGSFVSSSNGLFSANDLRQAYLGSDATCQTLAGTTLDGSGEIVAIMASNEILDIATERSGYIAMQPTTSGYTGTITHATRNTDNGLPFSYGLEAPSDMEMVMAMAPGANIQLFHDQANPQVVPLQNIAATDGISVATQSYTASKNPAILTALMAIAARGISFFSISGDAGDLGDTLNWVDLEFQTFVGGSIPNVSGGSFGPPLTYANPYYNLEGTWNQGCGNPPNGPLANQITGGGILNGNCTCFPEPSCCSTGTPIPWYQQGVAMNAIGAVTTNGSGYEAVDPAVSGNGGSAVFRNFPDVAAAADYIAISNKGQGGAAGTSLASPLWAGFAAVANQLSALQNVNSIGYANPVLYGLGKSTAPNTVFHDVADGVFNQEPIPNLFGLGHPAVVGYDLATGWGSFSCPLMQALGSPSRSQVWIRVANGKDGLNDQTSVDVDFQTSVASFSLPLKAQNETGWSDGGLVHDRIFDLGVALRPADVTDIINDNITVVMHENGGADNWDIGGIQVYLVSASTDTSTSMACLVDLSGNDNCNNTQSVGGPQPSCQSDGTLGDTDQNIGGGDTGVARLSENNDGSGQGTTATFGAFANNTGCPTWSTTVAAQPFHTYELVVDTGTDGINAGSSTTFTVLTSGVIPTVANSTLSGKVDDRVESWLPMTSVQADLTYAQLGDDSNNVLQVHFDPNGDDEWHFNSITLIGRPAGSTGPDTCLARWEWDEDNPVPFIMNSGTEDVFFQKGGACK